MRIVEARVTRGGGVLFDLEEFLGRPLFAHLSTSSEHGPRESPVWFVWEAGSVWIIGGPSFSENIRREPRCALGIVDFDPSTGRVHHVGFRGIAVVLPLDLGVANRIFRKYCGADEDAWDPRFSSSLAGQTGEPLIRFDPETVVIRDQSYKV
jgi:hypothetical protein